MQSLIDADEFRYRYVDLNFSQSELCSIYKCGKPTIQKWLEDLNLPRRSVGGGNNRRYKFTNELKKQLQELISRGYSNNELEKARDIKRGRVGWFLKKFNLKRTYPKTEYEKYARKVRSLSEQAYKLYKNILNPQDKPRTICGIKGGHQLDHVISITKCFREKHTPEFCAALKNLQFIPWEDNLARRYEGVS